MRLIIQISGKEKEFNRDASKKFYSLRIMLAMQMRILVFCLTSAMELTAKIVNG